MDLIKEAIKRGYKEGTVIKYTPGRNNLILGSGEFEINEDGNLIKYEYPKSERNIGINEDFDTIYDHDGWTKIVNVDIKTSKLTLEIIEAPEGIFTAQIKEVRGAVVQSGSEDEAIEEIFKQVWLCVKVDRKNFKIF